MKHHSTDDLVRSMARVHDETLAGFADRPGARHLAEAVTALDPSDAVDAGPSARRETERRRRGLRLPGLSVRLAAVGALAVTAVAGAGVLGGGEEEPPGPTPPVVSLSSVAEAAHVLDRAAAAAEKGHFRTPRPHQWIYTRMRLTTSANAGGVAWGGPYKTDTWDSWRRVDGKQDAALKDGRVQLGYETVDSAAAARYDPLPSDPDALLRKVGAGGGGDELTYEILATILRESVHSPAQEAAIFRAIKRIPGVTLVEGKVDADGRPAIALGLTVDGWLHQEMLLDPRTYAYLGERAVTIKDRTFESEGEPRRTLRAGTVQRIMVRVAIGVVDKPGQKP
ncbi:CU044_5270 family protein [Spirillospora sp. NPDC049024]